MSGKMQKFFYPENLCYHRINVAFSGTFVVCLMVTVLLMVSELTT